MAVNVERDPMTVVIEDDPMRAAPPPPPSTGGPGPSPRRPTPLRWGSPPWR
jgi:hypothetical protein